MARACIVFEQIILLFIGNYLETQAGILENGVEMFMQIHVLNKAYLRYFCFVS